MSMIDILLLLFTLGLELCLAGALLRRRTYAQFPSFFVYIAAYAIGDAVKFGVKSNHHTYFEVYWAFESLYVVLAVLALHEAFRRVFYNFFRIYRWFWILFPSAIALIAVFTALYAVIQPPVEASRATSLILSLEIGVNVIQAGLFLLFRGAMWFFRARRRSYAMGIVDGFAVMAAAGLIYGLRSEFGTKFALLVQYGVPVAYILAQVIWLDTFLRKPEPGPQLPQGATLEQALDEMARNAEWMKELSRRLRG